MNKIGQSHLSIGILRCFCLTKGSTLTSQDYDPNANECYDFIRIPQESSEVTNFLIFIFQEPRLTTHHLILVPQTLQ
jgi:hypothetical protein